MKQNQRFSVPFVLVICMLLSLASGIGWYFLLKKSPDLDLLDAAINQYYKAHIAQCTLAMKSALDQGANVNAQTSKGVAALVYCADYNNAEGVKLLLAHHADVNIKTWGEDSALAAAKRNQNPQIIEMLQQAGAKE